MDISSFLNPGGIYPVLMVAETEGGDELKSAEVLGQLRARRRGPFWLSPAPHPRGRVLTLNITLKGFKLDEEGSLIPAETESAEVFLKLLAQVKGCRFFVPLDAHVLSLKLLGRIWPD